MMRYPAELLHDRMIEAVFTRHRRLRERCSSTTNRARWVKSIPERRG